jgi:hypothetical protein
MVRDLFVQSSQFSIVPLLGRLGNSHPRQEGAVTQRTRGNEEPIMWRCDIYGQNCARRTSMSAATLVNDVFQA